MSDHTTLGPTTLAIPATMRREGAVVGVMMIIAVEDATMNATGTMTGVTVVIATTTVKGGMMTAADTTDS